MKSSKALEIIRVLADGCDPFTGEEFPDDSPYQHPRMIRALYKAVSALELQGEKERRQEKRKRNKIRFPERAGYYWTDDEVNQLVSDFDSGQAIKDLADKHKRTVGAIEKRLIKLGKIESKFVEEKR